MKSIKTISIFALAAFAFAGCQSELELTPASPIKLGEEITITASREMGTKTCLGENNAVLWGIGDQISVFYGDGDNGGNQFISQNLAPAATAEFKGTLSAVTGVAEGNEPVAKKFWGVSPYNVDIAVSEGVITTSVPQLQDALENSFDPASFPAVACSDNLSLPFRNAFGLLEISLEVEGVHYVVLNGHNDEVLWGPCSIALDNGIPVATMTGDPASVEPYYLKVGIKSIGDDPLSTSCKYYMALPPTTFTDGVEIVLYDKELKEITRYSGEKEVKIERSKVHAVTLTAPEPPQLKVSKLWEKLSTEGSNWFTEIGGAAGADFNIAIDDQNVYIPQFGGSKNLWAIDIATGNTISKVNTSTVVSKGFDGSIFLSCARVVRKNDGTPVLIATNLAEDSDSDNPAARLYVWDNGIAEAPRVVTMQSWGAGRRLGDTFTTYGNYEDCWLLMSTQTGNGFVTFRLPPTGETCYLISRLAIETGDFCSYYPFPGDLLHGMFTWRGGTHDDGMAYRNRLMTISSTEEAIKSKGAHTSALDKLSTWMGNYENNNGSGFNYVEFNGKRYVIWVINMADGKTFDIVIKEGSAETPWQNIINTKAADITAAGGFAFRESLVGGMATTWKQGTDCAVWNTGKEVYIAVNKCNVGLAVYKMYLE